jgi:GntR family transcriptional regulator
VDVPIAIRPESATPIYLQIRYQLAYHITSGRLPEATRLPTVRAVADHLGVNPGTVAQAYRDLQQQGLLEASPGRGTFVATTLPIDLDATERRRLLDDAVRRAVLRARGLGFADAEVRQFVDLALAATDARRPVLFAAPTMAIARKYATSIERRLGPSVDVHPVTFDAIASRSPHVATLLESAFFVVTFAGLAKGVERDLERFGLPCRVLGCSTEVQPHTVAALRALAPETTLCVVTQEPYLPQTLELLVVQTGRAADEIDVCLDGDASTARRSFSSVGRVVYTFAARDFVIEHGVPVEQRLEVTFDLTDSSVARLRRALFPNDEHHAATPRDARGAVALATGPPA